MKQFMRKREFVILSAELEGNTVLGNLLATNNLESCLDDLGLQYKQVEGCYKGVSEVSFMVMTPCESTLEVVKDLGLKSFGQESVLFRGYDGRCVLYYGDGGIERLGTFKQVSQSEALQNDAYTLVDGKYWIIA